MILKLFINVVEKSHCSYAMWKVVCVRSVCVLICVFVHICVCLCIRVSVQMCVHVYASECVCEASKNSRQKKDP